MNFFVMALAFAAIMSNIVNPVFAAETGDQEKIVIYYDDLGDKDKSPHLVQGKHLKSWSGKSTPDWSVAHDKKAIIIQYEDLDDNGNYELELTHVSTGKRVQKLVANDEVLYDNFELPAGTPKKKLVAIPAGVIKEGKLKLEFENVSGSNTVLSEITLLSVGAEASLIKKENTSSTENEEKKTDNNTQSMNNSAKELDFTIKSTLDGEEQPVYVLLPENPSNEKRPLLVGLHSWGGTYTQKIGAYGPYGTSLGMYVICPHYRGPNSSPKAAGSKFAVQDIVDAVNYMKENYPIDEKCIYIVGASGGGHMALQMAAKHPEIWAGVSAWCGITDLAKWHTQCPQYANKIEKCCGGAPGASPEIDEEYKYRSPIFSIANAKDIPIQIVHGTQDKSVPVSQADDIVAVMKEAGFKTLDYGRREIGHTLNPQEMIDFVRQYKKD